MRVVDLVLVTISRVCEQLRWFFQVPSDCSNCLGLPEMESTNRPMCMKKKDDLMVRRVACVSLMGALFFLCSCGGNKSEEEKDSGSEEIRSNEIQRSSEEVQKVDPQTSVDESSSTPSSAESEADKIPEITFVQAGLVQLKDGGIVHGALVPIGDSSEGDSVSATNTSLYLICVAPVGQDRVNFYRSIDQKVQRSEATLAVRLPSGFSIYRFPYSRNIELSELTDGSASPRVSAVRFSAEQDEQRNESDANLDERLSELRLKEEELNQKMREIRTFGSQRRPRSREESMEQRSIHAQLYKEMQEVRLQMRNLQRGPALSYLKSLEGKKVAFAASLDELEQKADDIENTLLVSDEGSVIAIRHEGQWLNLKQEIDKVLETSAEVALEVTGSQKSVSVSCQVFWQIPDIMSEGVQMVAATTYELESLEGSSIEERMRKAERIEVAKSSSMIRAQRHNIPWSGSQTDLWVRLYKESDGYQKPFLSEKIQLSYLKGLECEWAEPPSDNIRLPERQPDNPVDFVKDRLKLDLAGNVCDLVTVGDGSILMVEIDQSPYWLPLDLRTLEFGTAPWKVDKDTLLAAQGGKVYLLYPENHMLEIWDVDSMKRVDVHVLQLEGTPVSMDAPLLNPDGNLMVATDKQVVCVDPVDFEIVSNNMDLSAIYDPVKEERVSLPSYKPDSLRLRSGHDGRIYTLDGELSSGQKETGQIIQIEFDPQGIASISKVSRQCISPKQRCLETGFPDHGGSKLLVRVKESYGNKFPSPPNFLMFLADGRATLATLNDLPVSVDYPGVADSILPYDRALYVDTKHSVALLPDGDSIHILKYQELEDNPATPKYYYAEDPLEIHLPAGTGHTVTANVEGEANIEDGVLRWTAKPGERVSRVNLKLSWTGELGSEIQDDFQFSIRGSNSKPEVVSADGSKSIPLKLSGMIQSGSQVIGLAGSGNVVLLSKSYNDHEAWSLHTFERLVDIQDERGHFFGDANRVYLKENNGKALASYDLRTGERLKEMSFGQTDTSFTGLMAIGTGYADTRPVVALEREGNKFFLELIDRDSLNPTMMSFSENIYQLVHSVSGLLASDPAGNILWSNQTAFFRKGKDLSITKYAHYLRDGRPDASGRFIVGSDEILDIGVEPAKLIELEELTGEPNKGNLMMDMSGKYLMWYIYEDGVHTWSIREIGNPKKELFKMNIVMPSSQFSAHLISDTNKLLMRIGDGHNTWGVFDFDVEELIRQLAP